MTTSKFKIMMSLMVALILCISSVSSLACTTLYVGSELTDDGATILSRSEDISNSYNKVFYVSPAGNHTACEVYNGCYCFTYTYTFTNDSYSYTAYQVSTPEAEFVTEEPTEGIYYAATARQYIDGERVNVEGFKIIPANWAESFYGTFDALSNLYEFGTLTDEQKATVDTGLAALQDGVYADFAEMQASVAAAGTPEEAAQIATDMSASTAAEVHAAAVELVNGIK